MYAYDQNYLEDAMCHMGEMLDYVVYDLKMDIEEFWQMFIRSIAGKGFEIGSPKYNAGMSGIELAREVLLEETGTMELTEPSRTIDCSKEYWAGWVLAYYQNKRNISFKRLMEYGITPTFAMERYFLHEADISKYVEITDHAIELTQEQRENRLRRLRAYSGLTQKQLSEKSGVSLRMVQLYEQGQNDISKAQVSVVLALAQTLHCDVKDLL